MRVLWQWNQNMFRGSSFPSYANSGLGKIFIRKQLSQSLEALREIKLQDMVIRHQDPERGAHDHHEEPRIGSLAVSSDSRLHGGPSTTVGNGSRGETLHDGPVVPQGCRLNATLRS